jgi:transposase
MRRETREVWRARLARWGRSGLTAEQFAAQEGVNPRTLTFWRWKLRRESPAVRAREEQREQADADIGFVELVSATMREDGGDPASPFEVVVAGGYRVRIAPSFEGGALGRLLDVLEARR